MTTLTARLAELRECRADGLVTEEEFADLRRRMLDTFIQTPATPPPGAADGGPGAAAGAADGCPPLLHDCSPQHEGAPVLSAGLPRESRSASLSSLAPLHAAPPPPQQMGHNPLSDPRSGERMSCVFVPAPLPGHAADPAASAEDGCSDAEFWCTCVEQMVSPSLHQMESRSVETVNLATMSEQYDITSERVEELFKRFARFDMNRDGLITADELASGLATQGFAIRAAAADSIVRRVAERGGGGRPPPRDGAPPRPAANLGINHIELDFVLTRLRLAELFTAPVVPACWPPEDQPSQSMVVCDYNMDSCRVRTPSGAGVREFFFARRRVPKDAREVQWLHVDATERLDRLALLRLAVKYHLHPLAIDDVIDNRTPTKIDRFRDYYVISAETISLARPDSFRDASDPPRVDIDRAHVSIFLSAPPRCDTLITIQQDRPDESSWLSMWRDSSAGGEGVGRMVDVWRELRDDLARDPPRRMREQGADFLLYEVLDRIVREFRPVTEAYAQRLGFFHRHPARRWPGRWLRELGEVQVELLDLARSIRPMRQVVQNFRDNDEIGCAARTYLGDVADAIEETLTDVTLLNEMCSSLEDSHQRMRDKRMNDTLFICGMISAIFLPGQFITGLYGMNFVREDGTPNMPELRWEYGYRYFWWLQIGCFCAALTGAFLLHKKG